MPGGVVTLAFDGTIRCPASTSAPAAGGSSCRAAGSSPCPGARRRARSRPSSVDEVLRSSPTLQANAAQILLDPHLRTVRYTAAARSFDNQGWYLGTSGVGALYLPDGAALPERLTFGLPSPVVGAVLGAPDGDLGGHPAHAARRRRAHSRGSRAQVVPLAPRPARHRHSVHPGARSRRPGHRPLGRHRLRRRPDRDRAMGVSI